MQYKMKKPQRKKNKLTPQRLNALHKVSTNQKKRAIGEALPVDIIGQTSGTHKNYNFVTNTYFQISLTSN